MDLALLQDFFLWCTIINGGLLIFSFLMIAAAGDWVYTLHSRWFPISRETFYALMYATMAGFKVIVITFNLVPYVAMRIIG